MIYLSISKDILEIVILSFVYLCFKWICYKMCVIYIVGGKGGVDYMLGVFKILYFRNYFFLNVYVFFFYLLVCNKMVRKYVYKIIINYSM